MAVKLQISIRNNQIVLVATSEEYFFSYNYKNGF